MPVPPDLPDLIGWSKQEALQRLAEREAEVEIRYTAAPNHEISGGRHQVVRQRLVGPRRVELVLAAFPAGSDPSADTS